MATRRIATNSTAIDNVEYDTEASQLTVEFSSGATADYIDVPESVFDELAKAPSVGRFFNQQIRGQYDEG